MTIIKHLFIIYLLIFSLNIFAQSKSDFDQNIDINSFDSHLLHEAILSKVNSYRDSLKLPILEIDEILEKSALNHLMYILKIEKLSHLQTNKKLKTPFDRVVFFDGDHEIVDENISSISITGDKNLTYSDIANTFLSGCIKGKSQIKLLTNSIFYKTGIQVKLDIKSKKLYIVHVYGSMPLSIGGIHSPANAYGIGSYRVKDCKSCLEGLDTLYKARCGFDVLEQNGNAILHFTDIEMFKKVFSSGKYYFSADLILKQQFQCGKPNSLHGSPYHDGYLFLPISKSQLLKNNLSTDNSLTAIIGQLPYVINEQYELNLVILKKRSFSSIKSHCVTYIKSPMYGFSLDVLPPTFIVDYDKGTDSVLIKRKELKFEIPFAKNKSEYSPEDIKPLIDSLNLNKFNITKINLISYSSVDGDSLHNVELQQKRVKSITSAFQSFQTSDIKTKITTLENWQAFKKDIKLTNHADLLLLSKSEIKKELKNDTIARELESILASHRKAILKISTEEKISYNMSPEEIYKQYKSAITDTALSLKNKILIQKRLFNYILDNAFDYSNLTFTPIPQTSKNIKLIYNDIALKYTMTKKYPEMYELIDLEILSKKEPKILLGIYAMMLHHWFKNPSLSFDYAKLKRNIEDLFVNSSVNDGDYYKLMVNYNIVAANYFKIKGDFKQESKAVKYVGSYYESAKLTNKDAYILANFFVFHSQQKNAINILLPKINVPDVNEDLLFYYLSLAVFQNSQKEKDDFDAKMEKALEINKERFCKLFGEPALSFQLMRDKKLKNYFCESCQENIQATKESIWIEGKEGENIINK